MLTLIYSAGLRGQEVTNLKISDVDFLRKTIHIRQSKYKKDRIVPLVVKYLGQYTHRVAITNQRILNIDGDKVTFSARDYRHGAAIKPVTMSGVELLRRFTVHILPTRFVKIRRYGTYNPTFIRNHKLRFAEEEKPDTQAIIKKEKGPETKLERLQRLTGVNPCLCPVYKTGRMIRVKQLPPIPALGTGFFEQPQATT